MQLIASVVPLVILLLCLVVFAGLRRRVHYALALVVVAVTFQGDRFGFPLQVDVLAVVLLAVALLISAPGLLLSLHSYPFLLPMIGYVGANIVSSIINSPDVRMSMQQSLILAVRVVTFFVVVVAVIFVGSWRTNIRTLMVWLMLIHSFVSFVALAIYSIFPTPFIVVGQDAGTSRSINGFFLEPNLYGVYVLCTLGLILTAFLFSPPAQMPFLTLSGLIGLVGLVLSYTRSAWLGFALIIGCLAVAIGVRANNRARQIYVALVVITCLLVCYFVVLLFSADLLGLNLALASRIRSIIDARSNSAGTRRAIWELALIDWRQHIWFGNGPLSFPLINGWLFSSTVQTLHDSGLIGLFFMLWICLGILVYTWIGYTRASSVQDKSILLGYCLAQIGLFFTSQFSSFFWGGFTWVLFGLAVGHSRAIILQWRERAPQALEHAFQDGTLESHHLLGGSWHANSPSQAADGDIRWSGESH